jgi:AsmA protein
LSGDIGFLLRDGALKGYDLQATLLRLEDEIARYRGEETEARATPEAETKFAELSGSFQARDGVFQNDDFAMKAPAFRVGGNGTINLPGDRIDYKLDVNVVDSVEGQGGKALDELRGARIPLKIYGPLAEPTFTLDLASLLEERAKEEVKKKILEELGVSTDSGSAADTGSGQPGNASADSSGSNAQQPAKESPPKDPKEALEDELKKKLTEGLLKGLGF